MFLNKMYGILYKNLYKKRREIMKNESLKIMLSVLAVGILLTGCRSKNEGNGTDNSSDRTTDQNKEKNVTLTCESINAEIMSPEEIGRAHV